MPYKSSRFEFWFLSSLALRLFAPGAARPPHSAERLRPSVLACLIWEAMPPMRKAIGFPYCAAAKPRGRVVSRYLRPEAHKLLRHDRAHLHDFEVCTLDRFQCAQLIIVPTRIGRAADVPVRTCSLLTASCFLLTAYCLLLITVQRLMSPPGEKRIRPGPTVKLAGRL